MPPAGPPQPPSSDPHLCALCHAAGTGCCVLSRGAERMFGLTEAEVARMTAASGCPVEAFTVRDQASPEFRRFLERLSPVFGQTMPAGRRVRLAVDAAGRCVFLGPDGCVLPGEARPFYCRLYPFWFTPDGRLMVLGNSDCRAQAGARHWRAVLEALGADEAGLRALFRRLEADAAAHAAAAGLG